MGHIIKRTLINPLWGTLSNEPLLTLYGAHFHYEPFINPLWGIFQTIPLLTLDGAHFQTNPY